MLGNSLVAEQLLASKEELNFMESVDYHFTDFCFPIAGAHLNV
jgi:hypothetical protein